MKNLPNMGERERGKPDEPEPPTTSSEPPPLPAGLTPAPAKTSVGTKTLDRPMDKTGWAVGLRQILVERWRWGALIAVALVVSRLSSN